MRCGSKNWSLGHGAHTKLHAWLRSSSFKNSLLCVRLQFASLYHTTKPRKLHNTPQAVRFRHGVRSQLAFLVFSAHLTNLANSSLTSSNQALTTPFLSSLHRFESLENLVFADRAAWDSILANTSIDRQELFKFLSLLHNNKDGNKDAVILQHIKDNYYCDAAVRQRYFLGNFDRLSTEHLNTLLASINSAYSTSHYDSKTDTSSSYATTDFTPRVFDQSKTYVTFFVLALDFLSTHGSCATLEKKPAAVSC